MKWRLNKIQYPLYNLGPGKRIGLWVQGCSLGCDGCISKTLWQKEGGQDIDILALAEEVCLVADSYDGLTISGGEPFDQYESFISFCAFIKKITQLNIYCFSGYTLKELETKFTDELFKQYLDFLMDGRYSRKKHDNGNVRGSTNQNLYRFIDGNPVLQSKLFSSNQWSVSVTETNNIFMAGIPKDGELAEIENNFRKIGIDLEFL